MFANTMGYRIAMHINYHLQDNLVRHQMMLTQYCKHKQITLKKKKSKEIYSQRRKELEKKTRDFRFLQFKLSTSNSTKLELHQRWS